MGHRKLRDARITTHVALTGRALGASRMFLCGERDPTIGRSVNKVCESWGGSFDVVYREDWQHLLRSYAGVKVHLTMYGAPLEDRMPEIRDRSANSDLLVVVGSEKVPGKVYELVDYNLSVTSQPHSEIGALALFLDRLLGGSELRLDFPGGKRRIIPQDRGKNVVKLDDSTS